MNRRQVVLLSVGLGLALTAVSTTAALTLGSSPAQALEVTGPPATVGVTGNGYLVGNPDVLQVRIGTTRTAKDVSAAIEGSNARMRKVQAVLRSGGVEPRDIRTTSFDVRSSYSKKYRGYYVSSLQLTVTIRDLKRAGGLISAAAAAGGNATRVYGISYQIEDQAALLREARDAAFADARAQAEQYAKLAGRTLGRVRTIGNSSIETYNDSEYLTQVSAKSAKASSAAAPASDVPLSAGSQGVSASQDVVWELN